MSIVTERPEQASKQIDQSSPREAQAAEAKLHSEAYAQTPDKQVAKAPAGEKAEASGQSKDLPALTLAVTHDFRPLPWNQSPDDGQNKLHMSDRMQKDSIVKMGEGPSHVAHRVLGPDASTADVKALTEALKEQYNAEKQSDTALDSLRIGHPLLNESNIGQVLDRIPDENTRHRIEDHLNIGWNDAPQPTAIPFDHDARPGETQPSAILDGDTFRKDLAAAAIDVGAAALRSKGQCAAGARLALNELPQWHIDGGTVDRSINKDPNGWRGGIKMADDLANSGLFDKKLLSEVGVKNLKEGYILGRVHFPAYVKQHEKAWEGEDLGDIDIVTSKHMPEDDGRLYHDSYVLIPKVNKPSH
jgi:hypothetical protein